MKKQFSILVFMAVFFLWASSSYAFNIYAANLESASLACTDGTRVFGIKGNGVISSAILVEKNGYVVYYNPEFEDIQHIQGIYCLQNAIVITGVHGSYVGTSVFPFSYESPSPEGLDGTRDPPLIEESKGETAISLYGDDRRGDEGVIIKKVSFYKPFRAELTSKNNKQVTFVPQMQITQAATQPVTQTVKLSTLTTCCGEKAPDVYTVLAYTDSKGASYMGVKDVDASFRSKHYVGKYVAPLPFIATNSMCFDGETYLYGMQENTLRAAKFSYEAPGKERLEVVDPSKAPLRPAIEVTK